MNHFSGFLFWLLLMLLVDASSQRHHHHHHRRHHHKRQLQESDDSSTSNTTSTSTSDEPQMHKKVVFPNLYYEEFNESRIIHGKQVKAGTWPAMAAILYTKVAGQIWCGGMVINDNSIVTAAHCLKGSPSKYMAYLGHENIDKIDKKYRFDLKTFIKNPKYDAKIVANDIGIIKLSTKIDFKKLKGVKRGCVPSSSKTDDVDTKNCRVLGWGQTDHGHTSSDLMELSVPVLDDKTCNKYVGDIYNATEMLCAGHVNKGKGTCYGDSGSPLICPYKSNSNMFTLIGVTSYGLKCTSGNLPSYFARITNYLDFIRQSARL